jgi:hypothetical protein
MSNDAFGEELVASGRARPGEEDSGGVAMNELGG